MQAAVMEDSNAINVEQTHQTTNYQDQIDQTGVEQPSSPTASVATPTSTSSGTTANATAAFSYDDLFPALPQNNTTPLIGASTPSLSMRVSSSQKTQVLHVPYEERKSTESEKFGEGESKRICQQITKETGAQIEIASGKNQSLTFLIKGKQGELLDARRKILMHFATQANKSVSIPKEHHRVILGRRGERLREIERNTATRITVPSQNDESDAITIAGTKEGIEKAEQEIRQLSNEQYKKFSDRTVVPKIYHPFIVGPYNENLTKIMEETGAKVNVPPQSIQKDEIVIFGEKDAVAAAKAKVEAIYKEMEKKCSTVSVEVAKSQHRFVIGPKGSTIAEILKLTGVWVEMPPLDSPLETITLRGPQVALGNALNAVYLKANSVKTIEIEVPNWIHKYVIGRKGANMKQLEEECTKVNVNCLDDKIKLEGDPENVEKAAAYLNDIVNKYQNYTYVVMTVNPSFYKHIIGKSGANVNRLKEELNVSINIDDPEGQGSIRIEGPKEGVQQAQLELQEKIDRLENEKSKDVIIDRRLHRSIIGAKGEKIREIKDRYRQVLITIPSPQENTDIVKLRGPKEDVDKCHKDLQKLVKEIQEHSHIIEVPIFKQFHKFVIGKGGANIKKIRDETQTKIDLPAEGDTNEVIVITGKKENVLEAKERIQKIQNELSDIVTDEVQISPKYYNSIIGTGGKLISAIMEECGGVSIKFPTSDSKSDKVTIRGPKDDVKKAKTQLMELASERQLASFTAEVRAKQHHHKFIIGKNGASIRKIRDATGAHIIFPSNEDEDKEVITIIGKEENVKIAKEKLEAIIKDIDEVTESEILVDPKHHKHFVQKRGEVLNRISEECGGIVISFPRPVFNETETQNNKEVLLKGPKECIEAAKQRIAEIVADLEAQVTIEVVIPQRLHRTIMGSRGFKVQQVTSEHDVQIKFPDRDDIEPVEGMFNGESNGDADATDGSANNRRNEEPVRHCDIIRITGRIEKCEAAKQALIDLIPITEDINVPYDLHRTIIGPKGANVRKFMSTYDVHIELPPSETKSDIIKVTGTPAHVAEAKQALQQKIEEYEAERADRELRNFVLQIDVDPEYHSKLIGRRGAVINKLRADHDVNISLPKRDEENQRIITITGYQANAEAARDAIMKIVADLQDLYREVIEIDSRVHSHIIGQRGRTIRKIIEDFKVDIKFSSSDDTQTNPDAITIIGQEEDVENAKEHLLNMAEDYIRDFLDSMPSSAPQPQTVGAFLSGGTTSSGENGFVIKDAPWERANDKSNVHNSAPNTQSQEDFPDFAAGGGFTTSTATPMTSAWGPKH